MPTALLEPPSFTPEEPTITESVSISVRVHSSEPHIRIALAKIKGGDRIVLTLDEIGHTLTGEREPVEAVLEELWEEGMTLKLN